MNTLAIDILTELRPSGKYGMGLPDLLKRLRAGSHRLLAERDLELALRELDDATYATRFVSPLSGPRWRITGSGEDALKQEGL